MADITVDQLTTQNFYQIPQIFMVTVNKEYGTSGKIKTKIKATSRYSRLLSNDAKLAYAAFYNRCMLSIKSFREGNMKYVDDNGAVFLEFTIEDLEDFLDKKKTTVIKIKKELRKAGLLREVSQGANRPNRLYLQNVDASAQEYEYHEAEVIETGRDKGKVIYHHVKTTNHLDEVIWELPTETEIMANGSSKNEPPTNPVKSMKNGGSKNGRPENEPQGVQILNPTKNDLVIINKLDNSSRKGDEISDEISPPAQPGDTNSQKTSGKYLHSKHYNLLQGIADKYNNRCFGYPEIYTMTHSQKMQIGVYLETGRVFSDDVLDIIDRIPDDCDSPLAYLFKCLDNLSEERRIEQKALAHLAAQERYRGVG